jgi:hypothetical protein
MTSGEGEDAAREVVEVAGAVAAGIPAAAAAAAVVVAVVVASGRL